MPSDLLGQWNSIQKDRNAHKKTRPDYDSSEYSKWWDQDTALSQKIGEWGKQWTGCHAETLEEFIGWLRDGVAIIEWKKRQHKKLVGVSPSETHRVIWASRKADELGIAGRPAMPPDETTLLQAASFYDAVLVAIFNNFDAERRQRDAESNAIKSNPNHPINQFLYGPDTSIKKPLSNPSVPASNPTKPTAKKRFRPPSEAAFCAYRVQLATGRPQTEIAALLSQQFRRPIKQNQVSRYIKQVEKYLSDGNILPNIPKPQRHSESVDPSKLDLGRRVDSHTPRQRQRSSND